MKNKAIAVPALNIAVTLAVTLYSCLLNVIFKFEILINQPKFKKSIEMKITKMEQSLSRFTSFGHHLPENSNLKSNVSAHDMRAKYQVKKSLSKITADTNSDEI